MVGTKRLLAALLFTLLLAACSGKAPDYVDQAFPPGSSFQRIEGQHPQGVAAVWRAADKDGQIQGYLALAEGQGFNGPVQVAVTWTPGQGISRVEVVHQEESPDYGGEHLHSPWFTDQFLGNPAGHEYSLVKMQPTQATDVVIITGATMSSRAALQAVNSCLDVFRALEEEELR